MRINSTLPLLLLLFFIGTHGFSQDVSEMKIYNTYKNEIGLDFQNIFNGSLGTSLIYKRQVGEIPSAAINSSRAWRYLLSISLDQTLEKDTNYSNRTPGSGLFLTNFNQSQLSSTLLAGHEWRKQRNKFQFFYGIEGGLSLYRFDRASGTGSITLPGNVMEKFYYRHTTTDWGIPVNGFFGIKYFFLPELSLSVETALRATLLFSKHSEVQEAFDDGEEFSRFEETETSLQLNFDYLRFLNLSYYF